MGTPWLSYHFPKQHFSSKRQNQYQENPVISTAQCLSSTPKPWTCCEVLMFNNRFTYIQTLNTGECCPCVNLSLQLCFMNCRFGTSHFSSALMHFFKNRSELRQWFLFLWADPPTHLVTTWDFKPTFQNCKALSQFCTTDLCCFTWHKYLYNYCYYPSMTKVITFQRIYI